MKTKGIYFLYRVLQALGLPWLLLYFLFRSVQNRAYWRSLTERFGFLPLSFKQTGPGAIWLHAVSVGEVLSCIEFLRQLRQCFPNTRLFVSTSTVAGRAVAAEKLRGLADGVFYVPVDYVWAVRRALRALKPSLVIVVETEIWPNLFREVKRTGAGLILVNARISDRAFPRYLRLRWFFRAVLPQLDCILVQSDEMGARFASLGASLAQFRTAGNFKYDFDGQRAPADSPVLTFLDRTGPAKVWIAASTMPPASDRDVDEDDAVLAAFAELAPRHRGLLLVLVPRKPDRFELAARKLEAAHIRYLRRSRLTPDATLRLPGVLLLDSVGELAGLFFAADVVFMGGSLANRGGHNLLEPAFFSKPIIIGPHMENFEAVSRQFCAAGACVEIAEAGELGGAVESLLNMQDDAREIGRRAFGCAEASRGATARAVAAGRDLYDIHLPAYRPALPWLWMAGALSRIWAWGVRRQARARPRELKAAVISVGNLTMGGTGKTPCVLYLASLLSEEGRRPGILTRGYGRPSPAKPLVLHQGAAVASGRTGDEAQLFLRSRLAPVGIGADRFQTGEILQRDFGVDVLLLDDGFQHQKLARDVDIVLIDALNPFGGGSVFPLGRLREPPSGLARADIILITRSNFSDLPAAIEVQVRRWNPGVPVFRACLAPDAWIDLRTGQHYSVTEPPFGAAAAFCGLGNPQSFRRTLERLGVALVDWLEFEDHHRYRPQELRRIAAQAAAKGASALLTTQKDAINLCEDFDVILAPLPVLSLEVKMAVEREGDFLHVIARCMQ